MAIKIRHQYDGEQDAVSEATGIKCLEKGRTKQSEKDEADINFITKRYEKTGILPQLIKENPVYGDFSDMPTFQEALHIVSFANEQFAALDAPVRARFGNDPAKFLAFASDKSNMAEMVKMGLAEELAPTPAPASPSAEPAAVAPAVGGNPGAK